MPLTDLAHALMLLTRFPVARLAEPADAARCVWAFPVVGLIVNGIGGLVYAVAHWAGMPPLLAAAWALAATMMMTGALHEDGLADTADGFGGGATPARKMAIMRDSRIGTYGTLALVLSTGMRAAAIAALGRPAAVMAALGLAGVLGRAAIIPMLLAIAPARTDGMGAALGRPHPATAGAGIGLAIVAAFLCLPPKPAAAAVVSGFGAALVVAIQARRQIGGYTGDTLGAGEIAGECSVLTVLAVFLAA